MPPKPKTLEVLAYAAAIALCVLAIYLSLASPGYSLDNKVVYQGF